MAMWVAQGLQPEMCLGNILNITSDVKERLEVTACAIADTGDPFHLSARWFYLISTQDITSWTSYLTDQQLTAVLSMHTQKRIPVSSMGPYCLSCNCAQVLQPKNVDLGFCFLRLMHSSL